MIKEVLFTQGLNIYCYWCEIFLTSQFNLFANDGTLYIRSRKSNDHACTEKKSLINL